MIDPQVIAFAMTGYGLVVTVLIFLIHRIEKELARVD